MKKYLDNAKTYMFLDILFSTLYTFCVGAIPIVTKFLLDYASTLTLIRLGYYISIYLSLAILCMIFQYFSQYFCWKWTANIEFDLRYRLLNSIMNFDFNDYQTYKKDEYLSMFSNDITAISDQYFLKIVDIIKSSLMLVIYGAYMVYFLNIYIALVIVFTSLLTLFLPKLTGEKLSDKRVKYINSLGNLTNTISDILSGFALTNIRNKKNVMDYFNQDAKIVKDNELRYGHFKAFTIVFNGLMMYLLDIAAFSIAGLMLVLKKITVGTATATLSYVKEFVWPIRYIIDDINEINAIKKVVKKNENINARIEKVKEPVNFTSQISFQNAMVDFEAFRLATFNYNFEKGKKYLIIGPSGSGKSTILNCINQQVSLTQGHLLLDEKDMADVELAYLLSGVYKGNHIYDTTVLDNITMFSTYRLDALNAYLKSKPNAKINDLMKQKDATNLSNGEKQMVSLLRVYLSNTPIVLLDEAFSAIDVINRPYFIDMFLADKNRLVVMISHDYDERLVAKFDKVLKINNGKYLEE